MNHQKFCICNPCSHELTLKHIANWESKGNKLLPWMKGYNNQVPSVSLLKETKHFLACFFVAYIIFYFFGWVLTGAHLLPPFIH